MRWSLVLTDIKPIAAVPPVLRWLLAVLLCLQIGWHHLYGAPKAALQQLPSPPSLSLLHALALGDDAVMARLILLWLHAHDTQPGISLPFKSLDYERVAGWLLQIQRLDPRSEGALLSAVRVYGAVSDDKRRRLMLQFVYERFLERPNLRWRWLAEAAIMAKHRLQDLPLALRFARALREHANGPQVPFWARDMELVVLEDMGELQAARILVGGLLASGQLNDPVEIRYLQQKLAELETQTDEMSTP